MIEGFSTRVPRVGVSTALLNTRSKRLEIVEKEFSGRVDDKGQGGGGNIRSLVSK